MLLNVLQRFKLRPSSVAYDTEINSATNPYSTVLRVAQQKAFCVAAGSRSASPAVSYLQIVDPWQRAAENFSLLHRNAV